MWLFSTCADFGAGMEKTDLKKKKKKNYDQYCRFSKKVLWEKKKRGGNMLKGIAKRG